MFGRAQRRGNFPVAEFITNGQFDINAPGSQCIQRELGVMRRAWAAQWNQQYGLILEGNDHAVSRQLNERLLTFLGRWNQGNVKHRTLDPGGFPIWKQFTLQPTQGQQAVREFLEELKTLVQQNGRRRFSRVLNVAPRAMRLLLSVGIVTERLDHSHDSSLAILGRYLQKHNCSGLFGALAPAGEDEKVQTQTRPSKPTWPTPVATAYGKWERSILQQFPSRHEFVTAERLATIGVIRKPDGTQIFDRPWITGQVARIISDSGLPVDSDSGRFEQITNSVRGVLKTHVPPGVSRNLSIIAVPDDVFEMRLGARGLSQHYARAEAAAKQHLINPNPDEIVPPLNSPDWNDMANHQSMTGRLFLSESERNRLRAQHSSVCVDNGWRGAVSNLWAHGVIGLESAMRAYLRASGFDYTPGRPDLTGDFWAMAFNQTVPPWRWQILREAYLAAWLWAWSQLLNGAWSPLNGAGITQLRNHFKSWLIRFGEVWGLRHSKVLQVNSGLRNDQIDAIMWQLRHDWKNTTVLPTIKLAIEYGGRTYEVPPKLQKSVLVVDVDASAWLKGIDCFVNRNDWSPGDGACDIYPTEHDEAAQAFKLIGNLFLAGHSRHGSLVVGQQFKQWISQHAGESIGTRLFSQFGLLDSQTWLEGANLSPLFDDSNDGILKRHSLNITSFHRWDKLGEEAIKQLWSKVTLAPLSYPMNTPHQPSYRLCFWGTPVRFSVNTFWPLQWMHRLLDNIPRGLSPFSQQPLGTFPHNTWQQSMPEFLEWRQRIWGPLFVGGKIPHGSIPITQPVENNSLHSLLIPSVASLCEC